MLITKILSMFAFGHPVVTSCNMLSVENWTTCSAHARVQHCCTNLARQLQYHATSTNAEHFQIGASNTEHITTCCNRVGKCMQLPTILRYVGLTVAIVWLELKTQNPESRITETENDNRKTITSICSQQCPITKYRKNAIVVNSFC